MIYEEYLAKNGIQLFPKQQEIIDDFYGGNYRELVAVLGRRSGKDMIATAIALRELEHLLSFENPFKHYKLAEGNPIYILVVSASNAQASSFLQQIKKIALTTQGLKNRLVVDNNPYRLYFLTDANIKENTTDSPGLAVMSVCHTYGDILGKRAFTLIFNELAHFLRFNTFAGNRTYSALSPSITDFPDSKIISLSTPRQEGELFHKLYVEADDISHRIAVRYPSWEMNPNLSKESLREEFQFKSDRDFNMEFGAEFLPDTGNKTISMRLPSLTINRLKKIAREHSFKENRDVAYTDIIRCAIEQHMVYYEY